jgi:hypothetical protein
MLPVKLFEKYTIAIDCNMPIEMFCGFYNTKLDGSDRCKDLILKTYLKINSATFTKPFLYDKLIHNNWATENAITINSTTGISPVVDENSVTKFDIINREQDLKLFIKVPAGCNSSIAVLEGDYRNFNDRTYTQIRFKKHPNNDSLVVAEDTADPNTLEKVSWKYEQNRTVLNFSTTDLAAAGTNLNVFKVPLISKLQLLFLNTGESYPFADRLVEYLCDSVITPIDEISDNIKRAQKVMNNNGYYFSIDGLWENKMQKIIYDYIMNTGPVRKDKIIQDGKEIVRLKQGDEGRHDKVGHTVRSTLFDVLGYVDKDAEKWYTSWKHSNGKTVTTDTIQNIDIYNGLFDI